jgi:hypothetical protein
MRTFLLAFTLTASSAFAQQPAPSVASQPAVDARFGAWLGCWRLEDDLSGTGARMCITPEQNGVRLQTIVGMQKGIDEVVIPDGVEHPIVDAECKGTERAEFSQDGARLFRTTEVLCGKEPPRIVKSIVFLAQGPAWINVQHVSGSAASTSVRVQRYRRSSNQQLADGSRAAQPDAQAVARSAPALTTWSIDDVIEASSKAPAEAIQAALTEVRHGFDLNKKSLVALDEGGVHDSVIDLMVALTYPKKFVVERAGASLSGPSGVITGGGYFDPFMSPLLMGTMADCYTPFGYGYRSYYSMCGWYPYSSFGYAGYGYPYYPYYGWVDIGGIPPATGGGGGTIQPQPEGRVVNGRGYTQIHDRQAEPPARVNGGGNGAGWAGSGGGSATSGGYSSGSSSGGSGGSGGGGGDSGARVAVPKGGGG